MNLIANADLIFMLVFVLIILRTDMTVDLILIDSLQCDCVDHIFDFVVSQKVFVRISISTNDSEEIQRFFDRLMSRDVTTHNTKDCESRVLMIERSQK
jgi:hypothetical protein